MQDQIKEKIILATMSVVFSPERFEEVLAAIRPIIEQSKLQPGCLSSRIYRDGEDNNTIVLQQLWTNKECLDRHIRSDEYRQLLVILDMASEQPEIRFDTILSSMGIEIIEKARKQGDGWVGI